MCINRASTQFAMITYVQGNLTHVQFCETVKEKAKGVMHMRKCFAYIDVYFHADIYLNQSIKIQIVYLDL